MSYTQVFGGNTIYPSDVSYLALALTEDVFLQWPLETATGNNIVARIMDVTPSGAYSVFMPDATQTGVGQVTQFKNLGPSTITIKDFLGATLLSISAGLTFTLYLTDNTAADGSWQSFQAGASTAQAQASALAGSGLIAQGSLLSQSQDVTVFNSDFTLGGSNRSAAFVWEGGIGALTLPSASSVGNNWFVSVRNNGQGNLTLTPQGSDQINNLSTLVLRPEDSATVITDGINFFTVGFGQQAVFAFDYTSIDLGGLSGDYTLSGAELNRIAYSFVGAIDGDMHIILPSTTQQYWVANDTTGGSYTLDIATVDQMAPVAVPRDSRGIYYCNGTAVVKADTASIALPIAINDGGTGASTAGGALINLGGTTTGIGVFTSATEGNARNAIGAASAGANSDITSLSGLLTPLSVAQGGTGITNNVGVLGIEFVIDGGGAVITAGTKGYLEVPFACTISRWTLLANASGSIVVDVLKSTYSGFPTTSSITASATPTLSSAQKGQSSSLSGWTTSVSAGNILEFKVTGSPATVTRVTISLTVTRT